MWDDSRDDAGEFHFIRRGRFYANGWQPEEGLIFY